MKYSFTINQVAAVQLGDIDAIDCMIIEWLRDLCVSQSPAIVNERRGGYTWVSHSFAVNDMPLLGFKDKSAFRHRVTKLVQRGYFKAKKIDQRAYLKPLPKMDLLFAQPGNEIRGSEPNRGMKSAVPGNEIRGTRPRVTGVNRGMKSPNPYPNTITIGKSPKKGPENGRVAALVTRAMLSKRFPGLAKGLPDGVDAEDIISASKTQQGASGEATDGMFAPALLPVSQTSGVALGST